MGFDLDRSDADPLAPPDEASMPAAPSALARVAAGEADEASEISRMINTIRVHATRQPDE
jgi:hypothetical protein